MQSGTVFHLLPFNAAGSFQEARAQNGFDQRFYSPMAHSSLPKRAQLFVLRMWYMVRKIATAVRELNVASSCMKAPSASSTLRSRDSDISLRRDFESSVDIYDAMRTSRAQTAGSPEPKEKLAIDLAEDIRVVDRHQVVRYSSSLYEQFMVLQRHYSPRRRKSHIFENKNIDCEVEEKDEEPHHFSRFTFAEKRDSDETKIGELRGSRLSDASKSTDDGEDRLAEQDWSDSTPSTVENLIVPVVDSDVGPAKAQLLSAVQLFERRFHYCQLAAIVLAPIASVRSNLKLAKYSHNAKLVRLPAVRSAAHKTSQLFGLESFHWHTPIRTDVLSRLSELQCKSHINLMWHNHDVFQAVDYHFTRRQFRKRIWRKISL